MTRTEISKLIMNAISPLCRPRTNPIKEMEDILKGALCKKYSGFL